MFVGYVFLTSEFQRAFQARERKQENFVSEFNTFIKGTYIKNN